MPLKSKALRFCRRFNFLTIFDKETSMERILFNAKETAYLLSISERFVRKLDAEGLLRASKIGARKLYHIDDIRSYADSCRLGGD